MFRTKVIQFHPLLLLLLIGSYFLGLFIELIAFFIIITIHELGHYTAARYFKWKITRLMIWPFGGVMETEDFYNRSSREELWVIIAGPLQHIWIYIVLLVLNGFHIEHIILDQLWMINTVILLFNLIPILPLDGGRILFVFVSQYIAFHQAIIWMSIISMTTIAITNILLYLLSWTSIHLTFLSIFLLLDNWLLYRNKHIMLLKHLLSRYFVSGVDQSKVELLRVSQHTPLSEIVKHFKKDCYHYIFVGNHNNLITEEDCLQTFFTENKPNISVSNIHAKEA
ncbi:M50 family metallopeptidase [Piscibacillus halophilus]|uniref:Sporulation factor SpoIVFB. Metallo peptidase. MEROPS family M50B n=1 Tax=Piscibacillus halophilus TaxID=571933 RepID=A0A1H9BY31_9BACI|nr:M50 family metallopeptidase [Piscibacillus halophilus]SEP93493.1 sporulation factor SpoIVFB. Metallo peptidase. MEROPS family M50B [Piscibacillus halophilus]